MTKTATKTEVVIEVQTVDRKLAQYYLGFNTRNRKPNQAKIKQLRGAIERGEWVLSNDAATFSGPKDDPTLMLNAQNRMMAISDAEEDLTADMIIAFGMPEESQDVADIGRIRSFAEMLEIRGIQGAGDRAAAVSRLYAFRVTGEITNRPTPHPTRHQLMELYEREPGLFASIPNGRELSKNGLPFPRSVATVLHYLMTLKDAQDADEFFATLAKGTELKEDNPIYVLRRQLLQSKVTHSNNPKPLAAVTIKAFNYWREGRPVQILSWRPHSEPFPQINEIFGSDADVPS